MATITNTSFNAINQEGQFRENERRTVSETGHYLPGYTTAGDRTDSRAVGNEVIYNYNYQGDITNAQVDGYATSSDVVYRNSVLQEYRNVAQRFAEPVSVDYDAGGSGAGWANINTTEEQMRNAMERVFRSVDKAFCGNNATRLSVRDQATPANNVKGRAGSPMTFIGNGDEAQATNTAYVNAGTDKTSALTSGGGYSTTSRLTSAWNDSNVSASERGAIKLGHFVGAHARIQEATDQARPTGSRERYEAGTIGFVPSVALSNFVQQDLPGVAKQNEYNTTVAGGELTVTINITVIEDPTGDIMLMPVTKQISSATGTSPLAWMADRSQLEICWGRRLNTKVVSDDEFEDKEVIRGTCTFQPIFPNAGAVIGGFSNS